MAWEAFFGPQKSKAMGPTRATKQPSNKPKKRHRTMNQVNELASVNNMVTTPMEKKAICCRITLLTLGRSPILPKSNRPTPDDKPMQSTKTLPSASGRTSLTYETYRSSFFPKFEWKLNDSKINNGTHQMNVRDEISKHCNRDGNSPDDVFFIFPDGEINVLFPQSRTTSTSFHICSCFFIFCWRQSRHESDSADH